MSILSRTKGPAEKVTFPTCSQTVSPFQILPSFLTILGRKLDGGSQIQDPLLCMHACLAHVNCMHVAYFSKTCTTHVAFEWQGQAGAIQGYKCPCQGVRTLSMHACTHIPGTEA